MLNYTYIYCYAGSLMYVHLTDPDRLYVSLTTIIDSSPPTLHRLRPCVSRTLASPSRCGTPARRSRA